jgi:eukaryotic-like serine/threonine-protein kinase
VSFFRSAPSNSPATLLGGRYKLVEELGAGGFGQTFIAEDLHLPGNPRCVLKRLQPQITDPASLQTAKRLFDAEAQALYQLGSHDQIPRLLAHFEHEQEFYLAQELVVGQTLTEELIPGEPWSEAQVVELLCDLLGVLSFVHQQEVIHRDIKPANLMRRHLDRRIVLIDFGAVKQVSTQLTAPNSGATQTIAIGTPGYMPNEQLAGSPRFSSDVYAVGMVGIQALTGISPKSLPDDPVTSEILWRQYAPHVSEGLAAVLDKMIRYDFRARYAKAAEVLAAIEHWAIAPEHPVPSLPQRTEPVPVPQDTGAASAPTNVLSEAGQASQMPTEVGLGPRQATVLPPPLAALKATWLSTLMQLQRLGPRTQVLSLVGFAAMIGGLIAFAKPSPAPQPMSQSRSVAQSSPVVASPIPSLAPSPALLTSPATVPASTPAPVPDSIAQAAALLAQANQLRERKQFAQALDVYDKAIALNAQSPEAHWGRCYSLNTQEQFEAAIAACDAALKQRPDYAEALWSKGYARDRQGQDEDALSLYERATTVQPNLVEAWNNKGTALLQLDRPAEALAAFEEATRQRPTFVEAWNSRGVALWKLQRFEDAIASVDQALKIQPNYQPAVGLSRQMRQRAGRP